MSIAVTAAAGVEAERRHTAPGLVALVLLALAWGALVQDPGANQNAHLALVTALADGTPRIDDYREWTADRAVIDDHAFAAKAPGLALTTFPWYLALRATGLVEPGPASDVRWPEAMTEMPPAAVWQVGLFGATLAAFMLLLLVRSTVDRIVPGYGTVAAVCVGAGSLVGVFATMFFAHALSACLGFAAFSLLERERSRPPDLRLVALGGLIAGWATVVEFPVGIVAVGCGVYACLRPGRLRRALVYAAGLAVGLVPLAAFNLWAFGSPLTLSYANAVLDIDSSGLEVMGANSTGFFGVGLPSLRAGAELMLSGEGLLVITPLWALACAGVVPLWRSGRRPEAALIGALVGTFLLYNAAYWLPFGGGTPGPRFLVPVLPFLAIPLAAAWRARPLPAAALALVSVVITSASLVADPAAAVEDAGIWLDRIRSGSGVSGTVLQFVWSGHAIAQVGIVLVLVVAACAVAVAVTPFGRPTRLDVVLAVSAVVAWRIVYAATPVMLEFDRARSGWAGLAASLGLALSVVLLLALATRGSYLVLLPGVVLLPLLWPAYAAHTGIALVTVLVALAGLAMAAHATFGGRAHADPS